MPSDVDTASHIPSIDEIRSRTFEAFGKRPCLWQARICEAILQGNQDVISIAGIGMGKTLTFWMPLLFRPQGILLVITPLNILGKQNVETLEKAGINGIFVSRGTASEEVFRAITSFRYRVIVANPEELLRDKGGFLSSTFLSLYRDLPMLQQRIHDVPSMVKQSYGVKQESFHIVPGPKRRA